MHSSKLRNIARSTTTLLFFAIYLTGYSTAQPADRIRFNDQDLFLSGGNVAWVNFAADVGGNGPNLDRFEDAFKATHEAGGNAMRLWLHTTGGVTPEWFGNVVVGPGEGAIADLRAILDLAWEYEVGIQICLWSFDMLRESNGTTITNRAYALLSSEELTQSYIDNALIPMVQALRAHPAIIAWEIFNEAEGMSDEFGWNDIRHVPMSAIQRFVNMTAGAIHRTDTTTQVTNGAWSFHALWDRPAGKREPSGELDVERAQSFFQSVYDLSLTAEEVEEYYQKVQAAVDKNYYKDSELIAAGGDPDGTLDHYNIHYYEWAGTEQSPFHHDVEYWGLDKPLVVGEFYLGRGDGPDPDGVYGVPWQELYETLLERGYAGAMAWQWFNYPYGGAGQENWPRMVDSMERLFEDHQEAVDVIPKFRVLSFEADPAVVESGHQTQLSWAVDRASTITIDGQPVASNGTMSVAPEETSTYVLEASSEGGESGVLETTVEVIDPTQVNRALDAVATASSEATCCGEQRTADLAVDADPTTSWSGAWQDDADDNSNDEWLSVDLGAAYDVQQIDLYWDDAFGSSYEIDVSYDGYEWSTVHVETEGDGDVDRVELDEPVGARYVRIQGIERGSDEGYAIAELEIYGPLAANQPPTVSLAQPGEGVLVEPGSNVGLSANAWDPDGSIASVALYVDGDLLAEGSSAPFNVSWTNVPEGEHTFYAVAVDDGGLRVRSNEQRFYAASTDDFVRYQAENADYEGDVVRVRSNWASAGWYLDIGDDGQIAFADISPGQAGDYLISFRYNLFYESPKHQYLVVNGDTLADVEFSGAMRTWQERVLRVPLDGSSNTIVVDANSGRMQLDYIALSTDALNVGTEDGADVPAAFELQPNYPNPFDPETVIPFTLPSRRHVTLKVFDVTGREVAVLVDSILAAGTHTARFDAAGLASGVYFYRLEANGLIHTRKMALIR